MKRRFTILSAAIALLAFLAIPMGMWGQTRESYNVTYSYDDLGDMLYGSYLDASSYWKVPETSGNNAVISIPITYQPESDITVTFRIATFGSGNNPSSSNTTITAAGIESNSNWSGSGVNSYPSSSTYVNGVMTITKPQNPTTLGGLDITMGVDTGVKIFRLQSVSVSYTYSGGTPTPTTYTVTYNCNGGTSGCPENLTGIEAGREITLADAPTKTDYVFAGWSDGNNTYDEGDTYNVNSDVTFTAQWTAQSTGNEQWVLTNLADLTASDVFVIVGNNGSNYAMKNSGASNSGPVVVAVTVSGTELTGTIGDDIKWNITGDATNGYIFYPNGSSTTWLYCIDNNNGLRIGSGNTDYNTFKIQSDYIYNIGRGRYIGIYSNTNWRSYTSINSNIAGQTFAFYKKVTSGVVPPSITANSVEIGYNATSGSITYTINNEPSPAGTLTAAVTDGNWLTLGQGTTSPIAFTCTANDNTTARTATVTLTYTYDTDQTVTANVTVTQAAAPVSYTTIPDLFAAATGTEAPVYVTFNNWVVSGVSTNGKNVFVTDNDGNGFVIYGTNMSDIYTVGDILSGTAVSCTLKKYNGFAELLNVDATDLTITSGGTVSTANVALADLAGVNTGALLHYDNLTCSVDNNKYYLSDGTTTLQVYNALYAFNALENGKIYNITGVYQQYNNTKEILPRSADDIEEVVSTVPSITVDPDEVNVDAEEHDGTLGLTYENLTITDMEDFGIQYYDAEGEETTEPDWIEVLVAEQDPQIGEGYVVSYYMVENEGEARTAYFKVFAMGDEDFVYSNLVTVSQEAYVAPTGNKYVKVTSTADLTDGQYLIVYENGGLAFDGSLETLDAVGNTITVTINNNEIAVTETTSASEFTINTTAGTIKSASGYYIGQTSDANGLQASQETEYTNTISFEEVGDVNIVSSGAYLRYNNASNQNRFRYYKSASYTGQKAIQLYKKVEATETYTLTITGYQEGSKGGYHLIASPVTVDPATVEGMILTGDDAENYDLYRYDDSQELEWINYKGANGGFNLEPGKGYLYAKKNATAETTTTYNFTLTGTPYSGNGVIEVAAGWNLIGNPFNEIVYLEGNPAFYTMNAEGTEIVTATSNSIQAMEGIFVEAESDGTVTFTTTAPTKTNEGIVLNLSHNRGNLVDRAIVRFGEGSQLHKLQIRNNSTKVYIPQNNDEYAVVRGASQGEMPVSFRAAENGNYTLSINAENVELNYLHLIDNMTGANIDLLQNPSYSFDANTTDYESRFRLVYAANNAITEQSVENFAFFSNGNLIVNNEGNATLQVVDITGRLISSNSINGSESINFHNMPAGIYTVRLINGNDVKVQKVAVR